MRSDGLFGGAALWLLAFLELGACQEGVDFSSNGDNLLGKWMFIHVSSEVILLDDLDPRRRDDSIHPGSGIVVGSPDEENLSVQLRCRGRPFPFIILWNICALSNARRERSKPEHSFRKERDGYELQLLWEVLEPSKELHECIMSMLRYIRGVA